MTTPTVQKNKVIAVTYVLRNQAGEIYEYNDMGVTYLHGVGGPLFPKIEQALNGHGVGDTVTVKLSPAEGFGTHNPELTFTEDLENVPPQYRHIGAQVEAQSDRGETMQFVVSRIENDKLTIDANHPLTGQTVEFDVTVRDIRDATPEELQAGEALPPSVQ